MISLTPRSGVPKYDCLIRPTSSTAVALDTVAATLWQHFGFPANSRKRVLTRNYVVCTACSCELRYKSGDDANLRAHLRDEHDELYGDLLAAAAAASKRGTKQTAGRKPAAIDSHNDIGEAAKIETDYDNADNEAIEFLLPVESPAVEEEDCDEFAAADEVATESPAVIDADGLVITTTTTDDIKPMIIKRQRLESDDDDVDSDDYPDTTVAQPTLTAEDLLRHTAEMCAVDLRELDFCDGLGFAKLVMALSGHKSCPGSKAVRAELQRMRAAIHRNAGAASRLRPFALGLEKWLNADGQRFFTLSLLTVSGEGGDNTDNGGSFRRQSLCTWLATAKMLSGNPEPWSQAVAALDMAMCQAIVLNFDVINETIINDDDIHVPVNLPAFVINYELQQVRCLASVLDAVGQVVLSRSAVGNSFEQTTDVRWLDDLFGGGGGDDTPGLETDGDGRPREPHVLACLQTLHTALETVRMDSGATAALNMPLYRQLVENHFDKLAEDDQAMGNVKHLVRNKFEHFLSFSSFLSIVTFLDPRFQSLVSADPVLLKSTIKTIRGMCPKSAASGAAAADKPAPSVTATTATATNGKAGLSFLFGAKKTITLTPLDAELQRYAAAEALALEGCPRLWWTQHEAALPLLAAAAQKTLCVPAVLPPPLPCTLARRRGWLCGGYCADMASTDLDVLMTVNESLAARSE